MDLWEVGGPKSLALINGKYATLEIRTVVDPTACDVVWK